MPELPEVETIRRDLEKKILNTKIIHVEVRDKRSVNGLNTKFVQTLKNNTITKIDRRGKLMIWSLKHPTVIPSVVEGSRQRSRDFSTTLRFGRNDKSESPCLLVHLKMTGQLIYIRNLPPPRPSAASRTSTPPQAGGDKIEIVAGGHKLSEKDIECLPNQWTRIIFVFEDGGQLFFNDLRLFGYMKLANAETVQRVLEKFGPEPIATAVTPPSLPLKGEGGTVSPPFKGEIGEGVNQFTFAYFSSLFKKRSKTTIKAMLLNQELIAGLGNIYVDEVCFRASVRPSRRVGSVTGKEQKKLFACIPKILQSAIKHRGTTFRNFLDSSGRRGNYTDFLKVYDRDGEPCEQCATIIKKIKVAGRGTHFCPKCQK